jgi:hypothetical protein
VAVRESGQLHVANMPWQMHASVDLRSPSLEYAPARFESSRYLCATYSHQDQTSLANLLPGRLLSSELTKFGRVVGCRRPCRPRGCSWDGGRDSAGLGRSGETAPRRVRPSPQFAVSVITGTDWSVSAATRAFVDLETATYRGLRTRAARTLTSPSHASMDQSLWTVQDVSAYLGVPVSTLYQWRTTGYGPAARRVGKYLRYKPDEVAAWFEALSTEVA